AAGWLRGGAERRLEMGRYPDPVLRRSAAPVAAFGSDLRLLVGALASAARAEGAVGLAASQVGVDARVIVLDPGVLDAGTPPVLVNPRIVSRTPEDDMRWWRERCLVLPDDVLVTLMRDLGGRPFSRPLRGEAARALQHELDHLNGVLIVDHATDPADLRSAAFPELLPLEAADHERRQAVAFARAVED
ncbi:unnamed protein product, partial [Prorocentrum cordatum]